MQKLIVANWKLNPQTLKKAQKLASAEDYDRAVIAPPFPYLGAVGALLKNASLAAQDVFWENDGPYTGEVSASQLKDLGVRYVIVGHSERRAHLKETDKMINRKVKAILESGMEVILCIGEHLETRKKGIDAAKKFIAGQLKIDLDGVKKRYSRRVIIAYEPIWAIGTDASDIPEEAAEVSAYIKNLSGVSRVLYGGSVNAKNAKNFLEQKEIDGALIGGASLRPKEFKGILDSV